MALPTADTPIDLILRSWDLAKKDGQGISLLWARGPGKSTFYAMLLPECPETVRDFFGPGQHLSRGHGCGGTCRRPEAFLYLVPNRRRGTRVPRLYSPKLAELSASIRQHLPII